MRRILTEGAPQLSQACRWWSFPGGSGWEGDGDPTPLVREMIEVAERSRGIGLAAPQIGEMVRIIVLQRSPGVWIGCVNPTIVTRSQTEVIIREGCLSFPELWLPVKRPAEVKVAWRDPVGGTHFEEWLKGQAARVFQHELDHLDGLCFTDRVSAQAVVMARAKRLKAMN